MKNGPSHTFENIGNGLWAFGWLFGQTVMRCRSGSCFLELYRGKTVNDLRLGQIFNFQLLARTHLRGVLLNQSFPVRHPKN